MATKKALGRGLESVLGGTTPASEVSVATEIGKLKIDDIETNPYQPRKDFDEESLAELADSIRQQGVITPITVRKLETGKYQLIAGERRLRAAKMAALTEIPAYIRTATDQQMMEMAIVENIQRENLNAMEIALSYSTLIDECGITQEQLSEKVGKNRSTITNYLRLLKLPAEIQVGIKEKKIEMGHARAILATPSAERQLALYQRILREGLSVRKVEALAQEDKAESRKPKDKSANPYAALERELNEQTGLKIKIQDGKLTIAFANEEELNHIISKIR